jgi:hypothetical protein
MVAARGAWLMGIGLGWTTACGGVMDNTARDASAETSAEASAEIDADARPCDLSKPFASVHQVAGMETTDDEGNPSFSSDELTVYFFSNRQSPGTPDHDAYVATRRTRDDAFGAAAPLSPVNTQADERGGSISSDGLNLFFHSSRMNGYDLYVSTRPNTAAIFSTPFGVGAGVNTTDLDQDPFISSDNQALYFARTPAPGGNTAIYRASSTPTGFSNAVAVAELNTALATRPVLSTDGLTILFASDRAGGSGNLDIWVATRPSPTGAFGQITNMIELNASDFEFPDWLSLDGCRIYFTSRRAGGSGNWDIWQATRPR